MFSFFFVCEKFELFCVLCPTDLHAVEFQKSFDNVFWFNSNRRFGFSMDLSLCFFFFFQFHEFIFTILWLFKIKKRSLKVKNNLFFFF